MAAIKILLPSLLSLLFLVSCSGDKEKSFSSSDSVKQSLGLKDDPTPRKVKVWPLICKEARGDSSKSCLYRTAVTTSPSHTFDVAEPFVSKQAVEVNQGTGRYYLHIQYQVVSNSKDAASDNLENACSLNPKAGFCVFESTLTSVFAQLDNTPPALVALSDQPSIWNFQRWAWDCEGQDTCFFRFAVSSLEGYEFEDDHPFESKNFLELKGVEDGDYYLHVQAIDRAGNISDQILTLFTKIDASLPVLTAQAKNDLSKPQRRAWWALSCEDGNQCFVASKLTQEPTIVFAEEDFSLFDDKVQIYDSLKDPLISKKAAGVYYFHVQSKDGSGNVSEVLTQKITLDKEELFLIVDEKTKSKINRDNRYSFVLRGECSELGQLVEGYFRDEKIFETNCYSYRWRASIDFGSISDFEKDSIRIVLNSQLEKTAVYNFAVSKDTQDPEASFFEDTGSMNIKIYEQGYYLLSGYCRGEKNVELEITVPSEFQDQKVIKPKCVNEKWEAKLTWGRDLKKDNVTYVYVRLQATDDHENVVRQAYVLYVDLLAPEGALKNRGFVNSHNVDDFLDLSGTCSEIASVSIYGLGRTAQNPWAQLECHSSYRSSWHLRSDPIDFRAAVAEGFLVDGEPFRLSFLFTDKAGNTSVIEEEFSVDLTPPDLTYLDVTLDEQGLLQASGSCEDGTLVNVLVATVLDEAFTFADIQRFVKCKNQSWSVSITVNSLKGADVGFKVKSRDEAGNKVELSRRVLAWPVEEEAEEDAEESKAPEAALQ